MASVGADPATHLSHAAELERRDAAIARELETVLGLGDRAGRIRERATELSESLERVPVELADVEARRHRGELDLESARAEVDAADKRLAELERGRRRRTDEVERARSELATARGQLADVESQLARLAAHEAELLEAERRLRREAEALPLAAGDVARGIRGIERVTDSARGEPGVTLADLEEWGARVRAGLFVAQGTLETERERVVAEANALGTAVLGEDLGGSSVAVVRRRVEERLTG